MKSVYKNTMQSSVKTATMEGSTRNEYVWLDKFTGGRHLTKSHPESFAAVAASPEALGFTLGIITVSALMEVTVSRLDVDIVGAGGLRSPHTIGESILVRDGEEPADVEAPDFEAPI